MFGDKNNVIGYHGIWNGALIRAYHLPWLGFIIAGAIAALIALIPGVIIALSNMKLRICAFMAIVGALSFYGFGDAISVWINSL